VHALVGLGLEMVTVAAGTVAASGYDVIALDETGRILLDHQHIARAEPKLSRSVGSTAEEGGVVKLDGATVCLPTKVRGHRTPSTPLRGLGPCRRRLLVARRRACAWSSYRLRAQRAAACGVHRLRQVGLRQPRLRRGSAESFHVVSMRGATRRTRHPRYKLLRTSGPLSRAWQGSAAAT
jgi:hypothetical protein